MLNKNDANRYLAAILETLAIAGPAGTPSGPMYAAMMGFISLEDYTILLDLAQSGGLLEVSRSHLVTITERGKIVVEKVRAHREAFAQAQVAEKAS